MLNPVDSTAAVMCGLAGLIFIIAAFDKRQSRERCIHGAFLTNYCWRCAQPFYDPDGLTRCEHGVIGGNACAKCVANTATPDLSVRIEL